MDYYYIREALIIILMISLVSIYIILLYTGSSNQTHKVDISLDKRLELLLKKANRAHSLFLIGTITTLILSILFSFYYVEKQATVAILVPIVVESIALYFGYIYKYSREKYNNIIIALDIIKQIGSQSDKDIARRQLLIYITSLDEGKELLKELSNLVKNE